MKKWIFILAVSLVAAGFVQGEDASFKSGLVAHYFKDPDNWNGGWPQNASIPNVKPEDWTFREHRYSRVEPVINHQFVKNGWFSIRWTGYFDPATKGSSDGLEHRIGGQVNLNPNNNPQAEFAILLPDGNSLTRDDLDKKFKGYAGPAVGLRVKPKGTGNQNELLVDGQPYPLLNANTYDILGNMTVDLYNDRLSEKGQSIGNWWIAVESGLATILCIGTAPAASETVQEHEYQFELLADDGCRLRLNGETLIDSWQACSEKSPEALRRAKPVKLKNGPHSIVIEYFQGQSLGNDDCDPIRLYWTCKTRNIFRELVPAAHFSHGPLDLQTPEK